MRRGCSYHGLALNVDMDLEPFRRINPCGMAGLAMTQLVAEGARTVAAVADELAPLAVRRARSRLGWEEQVEGRPLFLERDEHDAAVGQVLIDPVELRAALGRIV